MGEEVRLVRDARALATAAARLIEDRISAALARWGRASLALSGGGTPVGTFRRLASRRFPRCDWRRVDWYWADERWVSARHRASNFGIARRELLRPLGVPIERIHPIPTSRRSAAAAALEYERLLRRAARGRAAPLFDLVMLGLGRDGHTASLFPGSRSRPGCWVEAVTAPPGVMPARRVTLTPEALNRADSVVFLVSGAGKRQALHDALSGRGSRVDRPSRRVVPRRDRIWLVDRAAAGLLSAAGGSGQPGG